MSIAIALVLCMSGAVLAIALFLLGTALTAGARGEIRKSLAVISMLSIAGSGGVLLSGGVLAGANRLVHIKYFDPSYSWMIWVSAILILSFEIHRRAHHRDTEQLNSSTQ